MTLDAINTYTSHIHSPVIHSNNKYIMSTYYEPIFVGNIVMKKIVKVPL